MIKPFVISRTFNGLPTVLWKAWTDPQSAKQWWGPKGSQVEYSKIDLRPGGTHHYCLVTADGGKMWGRQIYREIDEPKRLGFVNSFSDERGGLTRHPLHEAWPLELLTTVTFTPEGDKTTVTVEWLPVNATAEEEKTFDTNRDGMTQGWGGSFDQLEGYLRR